MNNYNNYYYNYNTNIKLPVYSFPITVSVILQPRHEGKANNISPFPEQGVMSTHFYSMGNNGLLLESLNSDHKEWNINVIHCKERLWSKCFILIRDLPLE